LANHIRTVVAWGRLRTTAAADGEVEEDPARREGAVVHQVAPPRVEPEAEVERLHDEDLHRPRRQDVVLHQPREQAREGPVRQGSHIVEEEPVVGVQPETADVEDGGQADHQREGGGIDERGTQDVRVRHDRRLPGRRRRRRTDCRPM
jgi:hypothetical protein